MINKPIPDLLFTLLKNMSVIVTFAYFLSRIRYFKKFLVFPFNIKERTFLVIFFGLLSLIGTYLGIYILNAYANIRGIGAMMGGLLGGPLVGILAGLIGGLHRYTLGGFTALACTVGTISTGLIGGLFHKKYIKGSINYKNGFLLALAVMTWEMIIVIIFSRPLGQALHLVKIISLPMILSNAMGISIFINILNKIKEDNEKIKAFQAEKVLQIADKTLPILQEGLNRESADKITRMIKKASNVDAVALTNHEQILAFTGLGSDHHKAGLPVQTEASKRAYQQRITIKANSKKEIGCSKSDCPLTDVVITPLKLEDSVFGLLKLYRSNERINVLDIKLAEGIASLLATQIKLSRLAEQAELKKEAELKALQAQINPHFLFNALNTIISTCRTNPEQSRKLLLKLSNIFRRTLKKNVKKTTLKDEIDFCQNYLGIEKARLGDRLTINWKLPAKEKNFIIPSFIIQPLVENAILHGIYPQKGPGQVEIIVKSNNDKLIITVTDNGLGMSQEKLKQLFSSQQDHIGLKNIKERLKNLYGHKAELNIKSKLRQGTSVKIILPLVPAVEGGIKINEDKNFNC